MLKKLLLLAMLSGLMAVQFSCKVTNDEDAAIDIDPVFNLDMIEDLENNKALSFWVESVELQICENYTISHNLEKTTSKLDIRLNEIIAPTDCIVGEVAAVAEIKLGELTFGRTYTTEFTIKNTITNKGILMIQADAYILEMESIDGFQSVVEKLYKIPNNLIWGYIAYNDENLVGNVPAEFLSDVTEITADKTLQDGYYGHFSIDKNGLLNFKQSPNFQKKNTFYFNYSSDTQALADLLETYRSSNNADNIAFKIFTANGDEL